MLRVHSPPRPAPLPGLGEAHGQGEAPWCPREAHECRDPSGPCGRGRLDVVGGRGSGPWAGKGLDGSHGSGLQSGLGNGLCQNGLGSKGHHGGGRGCPAGRQGSPSAAMGLSGCDGSGRSLGGGRGSEDPGHPNILVRGVGGGTGGVQRGLVGGHHPSWGGGRDRKEFIKTTDLYTFLEL